MKVTQVLAAVLLVAAACGTQSTYMARSKDDGAPFDLVLTETRREPAKSTLSVRGFHDRSAASSRWLMCIYNDLAVKRGFKYWTVIYPEEPDETFEIAFYQSPSEDVKAILGSSYVADRAFPPEPFSTERWYQTICGWKKHAG